VTIYPKYIVFYGRLIHRFTILKPTTCILSETNKYVIFEVLHVTVPSSWNKCFCKTLERRLGRLAHCFNQFI